MCEPYTSPSDAVLVFSGRSADEAMLDLSRVRGEAVPHRAAQRAWVRWIEHQVLQV